jgi:hypothetical protein
LSTMLVASGRKRGCPLKSVPRSRK